MSALSRFESFMENIVEGSVARLFRSPVQPAEIAKRLERAMEANQQISVRRVIVPNIYRAFLNPQDMAAFEPIRAEVEREMANYLTELAQERSFSMLEHPRVVLAADQAVPRRSIQVVAETAAAPEPDAMSSTQVIQTTPQSAPQKRARLLLQNQGGTHVIPLESTLLSIGRGLNNDIILEDTRVSRHHAQLRYRSRRFWIADLGSTNGTFVNSERITERALRNDDTISLGGLELLFKEA
jgi:predicted component of type VI protein secretion system